MNNVIAEFRGIYRFLSNFYPSTVEFEGETYATVEHAYQAAKTTDPNIRRAIRAAERPGDAKKVGRGLEPRPGWEELKELVMLYLLYQKFAVEPERQKLLDTGDAILQEGNTWGDTYWGVDLSSGIGQNRLGHLLMEVRKELRNGNR